MTWPIWLTLDVLLAIHDEQIAEHGGSEGTRDLGLLEGALARPQNLVAHSEPDVVAMAAALGFGIACQNPFVDGNKRTAYVAVETFLALNGVDLIATDVGCVVIILDLAAGELPEAGFVAWLAENTRKRG